MERPKRVAIIGAGTVGLSVVYQLRQRFSKDKLDITIIAEQFYQQTTSYNCGGLWEPYQIAGTPDSLINQWGSSSYEHFHDLWRSADASAAGVQLMTVYCLLEAHQVNDIPSWKDIVMNFQMLQPKDFLMMRIPSKFVAGYRFDTFVVDQKYYMKYMMDKLSSDSDIHIEQRKISSLQCPTLHQYDCILNCSGLGARELANDELTHAIRGQVLRVK